MWEEDAGGRRVDEVQDGKDEWSDALVVGTALCGQWYWLDERFGLC